MKNNQEESVAGQTQTARPAESGLAEAEAVRERAYQIFRERSEAGHPGDAAMDWLQAEHELCDRRKRRETEDDQEATLPKEKSLSERAGEAHRRGARLEA